MKIMQLVLCAALGSTVALGACGKPQPSATSNGGGAPTQPSGTHTDGEGGHHGPSLALGTSDIGSFSVRAARDDGDITPGGDAPIDVWIEGEYQMVTAVRFWIGTADASGSIKARADIENPDTPNHWHTHAMVPDPLPEGSKLWVEIETAEGKQTGSYDLHMDHSH